MQRKEGGIEKKEREREGEGNLSSYLALDSFWDSRPSGCHTAAPSSGFLPNLVLLGGWGGFAHSHSGIFFSSPQPRPSFFCPEMEPKKQVRGPRVRATASTLSPSFPSSEEGRKGAERATGGGERWCLWLTAAQSGGSGRLGADWEEKGLPPLPSPACCPSWSPRAPWLASPFSSLHLLDGCPLVTRGSLPVWIWTVSSLGPSWGKLCQIPKPLPSFP